MKMRVKTARRAALPDPSEMMTKGETAVLIRRSPRTLDHWRLTGGGPPAFRVGRRLYYLRSDVIKWLAEQREAAG